MSDTVEGLLILIGLLAFIVWGVWRSKRRAELLLLIGTLLVCGLSLLFLHGLLALLLTMLAIGYYFGQRKIWKAERLRGSKP